MFEKNKRGGRDREKDTTNQRFEIASETDFHAGLCLATETDYLRNEYPEAVVKLHYLSAAPQVLPSDTGHHVSQSFRTSMTFGGKADKKSHMAVQE
jgi:hypothetical protein